MSGLLQGFAHVEAEGQGAQLGSLPELTLEAREAHAISAFEHALRLLAGRQDQQAESVFRALLEEPVVAQSATDQLHRLKFLALKNLGDLLARQPGCVPNALAVYCQATEVVADDALLWNKLGTLAAEVGCWAAARTAFERGLELDPHHPTMPDKLLSLLAHTGDEAAAAALASAVLRLNPRHAGAASLLASQRRGRQPAATSAALLQLPPAAPPAADVGARPKHHPAERPRTLDRPTWHHLLHQSLLFLASNRFAEGGHGHGHGHLSTTVAGAGSAASPERKGAPLLARFNYKRVQPQQLGAGAAASPAASPAGPAGLGAGTSAQQSPVPGVEGTALAAAAQGAASPAPAAGSPQGTPAPPAVQRQDVAPVAAPDTGQHGATAPGSAQHSPVLPAGPSPAATPEAPGMLSLPAAEPAGAGNDNGQAAMPAAQQQQQQQQQQCSTAQPTPGTDEEQEQRHPNGRARGDGRAEGRATRSRGGPGFMLGGDVGEHTHDEEAIELLGTLGSLLCSPQRIPSAAAAASPLLSSPAKAALAAAQDAAGQQQAGEQQQAEEEAVKAFIRQLPAGGIGRHDLSLQLFSALATPQGAAQLAPAAQLQLLQVAHHVQHDSASTRLPAEHCLVLGELFADAAVAALRPQTQQGGTALTAVPGRVGAAEEGQHAGSSSTHAAGPSAAARRSVSMRGRRTELAPAVLQQSAQLWLSRYRLAAAEEPPAAPPAMPELEAAAARAALAADRLRGMARCWWATGRLAESSGDMPAAGAAYANCREGLALLGLGEAIQLPHCQADATISAAALHAKQEALQLHTVLEAASRSAVAGDHAAVVAALAPALLCCSGKEQQMLQLDPQQWQRGMAMLLSAAVGAGAWFVALRCHLRLLNAALPAVPPHLLDLVQGKDEAEKALPDDAAAVLHDLAPQITGHPAGPALDSAASFLSQHRANLSLTRQGSASGGTLDGQHQQEQPPQQQQQGQQLDLHPMECAMYEDVQRQLAVALAGLVAELAAAGASAFESVLNIKANSRRVAMCDAATVLLCLDSLAADATRPLANKRAPVLRSVERGRDLAWHLCDALGNVQALMERRGRFVQACMSELQSQLGCVDAVVGQPRAGASQSAAAGGRAASDAELRTTLTGGLQFCLLWLFGLDLPGLDKQEEWGGNFQPKAGTEAAARHLTSPQAVAAVWPLVEPYLLQDIEHVTRHKGFLRAAGEHFERLPAELSASSAWAWEQLAAAEPPHPPGDELACPPYRSINPMRRLLQLAALEPAARLTAEWEAGPAPMATGHEVPAVVARLDAQEPDLQAVRRSLHYLLSALQDAEGTSVGDLLAPEADATLEGLLGAAKADLCLNPGRCSTWERLAVDYHQAADVLLDQASVAMVHRQWKHDRDLQDRVRRWRRLAYWATAGAWLSAGEDEEARIRLLSATGSRLLEDVLRVLPRQDPLASASAWKEVKASAAFQQSCELAETAFGMAGAHFESLDELIHWEVLLSRARCVRKLDHPPVNWLPVMARACHHASQDGGALYPLYALHASRMRLLLAMPAARRWAGKGGAAGAAQQGGGSRAGGASGSHSQQESVAEELSLLQLVGSYCFLPASNTSLRSPTQRRRGVSPEQAESERRQDWLGLLEDCCAAMRWCLEKDKGFHRAAYRLADAMLRTGQPDKAVAALAPFFMRAKQAFAPVIAPIQEAKMDGAAKRGRKAQRISGSQQAQHEQDPGGGTPRSEVECNWGEPPARLASVGLEEDAATFGTRIRKTLCLYFSCLADATAATGGQAAEPEQGRQSPLDVLQAAAAFLSTSLPASAGKAWEGTDKLARGHFLLALAASLCASCPPEELQLQMAPGTEPPNSALPASAAPASAAHPAAGPAAMDVDASEPGPSLPQAAAVQQTPGAALGGLPPPHTVGPASVGVPPSTVQATPAEAAAGGARMLPTPATQSRHQQAALLLQVAARLEGSRAEPLLAKAHQVFAEYTLHAEGDHRWKSVAGPAVLEAQSTSSSSLARDPDLRQLCGQPELLRRLLSLYASLHVHLLSHRGAAEHLLLLLQAMKKRLRGLRPADAKQARLLRRQALVLSEAFLGAMSSSLASAEREAGAATPAPAAPAQQGEPAAAAVEAGGQLAQQQQGSPPPAGEGSARSSPGAGGGSGPSQEQQPQAAAKTPAPATGAGRSRSATPGTDLRAMLGTPGAVPSSQHQQAQERAASLLQVAQSFQRDVPRWLQALGDAAGASAAAREDTKDVARIGEEVVLRAFRLHARCTGQPALLELSRMSRAEQLKAAEEAVKQQRRQSRQQGGAAGRQQQAGAAAAGGGLPPIAEGGEEAAGAGRKRRAAGQPPVPQSTRKRGRSASVGPQQAQQEESAPAAEQEAAGDVAAAMEDVRDA